MDLLKPSYASGYAKNASQSAHPNLWDGLVGAWMPSLGVTGETLRDVSGNGNHGTLTNMDPASDWVGTSKGLALDFDGVNDTVSAGDDDIFSFGNSTNDKPFAVESICRFSDLNGFFDGIIAKDNGSVREWSLLRASSTFRFFIKNQGGGSQQSVDVNLFSIQTNRWYSVAASYDGRGGNSAYQGMKIYVDGVEQSVSASAAQSYTAMANTAAPLTIGSYSTNYFAGNIASSKLYNRVLSPTEIKQLYIDSLAPFRTKKRTVVRVPAAIPAATKVGSIKKPTTIIKPSYQAGYARNASESENPKLWDGLVGAWMPSLGVTGDTLRDVSGNGNHGTLTNMDAASDWVATSKGLALDFDGNDDRVLADIRINDLRLNSNLPRTVTCKFYLNDTGSQCLAGYGQVAPNNQFYLFVFGGNWYLSGFNNDFNSSVAATVGWHTFAVSYAGSNMRLFVDGKQIAETSISLNTLAGDLSIGARSDGSFSSSSNFISVLIHNRALSPTEIKQLYVDPLAPFRKKQRVSVAVPGAVTPTTAYHPLRSLAHPLEQ